MHILNLKNLIVRDGYKHQVLLLLTPIVQNLSLTASKRLDSSALQRHKEQMNVSFKLLACMFITTSSLIDI